MSCSSSLSVTSGSFVSTFEARKAHWAGNEWSSCFVPYASLFHAARLLTCSLFGSGACAKREDNGRTRGGKLLRTDTGKSTCGIYVHVLRTEVQVHVHVLPEPSPVSSDRGFVSHKYQLSPQRCRSCILVQNQTINIYISVSLYVKDNQTVSKVKPRLCIAVTSPSLDLKASDVL